MKETLYQLTLLLALPLFALAQTSAVLEYDHITDDPNQTSFAPHTLISNGEGPPNEPPWPISGYVIAATHWVQREEGYLRTVKLVVTGTNGGDPFTIAPTNQFRDWFIRINVWQGDEAYITGERPDGTPVIMRGDIILDLRNVASPWNFADPKNTIPWGMVLYGDLFGTTYLWIADLTDPTVTVVTGADLMGRNGVLLHAGVEYFLGLRPLLSYITHYYTPTLHVDAMTFKGAPSGSGLTDYWSAGPGFDDGTFPHGISLEDLGLPYNKWAYRVEVSVPDYQISGCGKIIFPGQYTLSRDITDVPAPDGYLKGCIEILEDDVTLDCGGHTIAAAQDSGSLAGIYSNAAGSTIQNCTVDMGQGSAGTGIFLDNATDALLQDNTLLNQQTGLRLVQATGGRISSNTITGNTTGVDAASSQNVSFTGNTITGNGEGVVSDLSQGLSFDNNTISQNGIGVELVNTSSSALTDNLFLDNLSQQAIDTLDNPPGSVTANAWDVDGMGNRWSNYDELSEGCADENGDGICDQPLQVPGGASAVDHFPKAQSAPLKGDMDLDGDVDFDDIDDFVEALTDSAGYETSHGVPPTLHGDMDSDGDVDFDDIPPFIAALSG